MEHINWYPGHMKKTRELIKENLKLVDVVVEVVDARIPAASRNPIIDELVGSKPRVVCLNKSDLADAGANKAWKRFLESDEGGTTPTSDEAGLKAISNAPGTTPASDKTGANTENRTRVVLTDCQKGSGIKELFAALTAIEKEKYPGQDHHKALRLMIVGVPNVGKSSLINRMTGKKTAQVGDRPGVTKGKQWLTLKNGMQLMDTPGILWPKFEDPKVGLVLAFCGSIKDEILDREELALELIKVLARDYPGELSARYKIEALEEDGLLVMEQIAAKRGFLMGGGRIDYTRTASTVLDEFRAGKIGRITLEKPEG